MMAQPGFFDHDRRLGALSALGDPLVAINAMVPWETFRRPIQSVVLTPAADRKSNASVSPWMPF
jgi:transposase, IS5 family